jgi:hypothetical protein
MKGKGGRRSSLAHYYQEERPKMISFTHQLSRMENKTSYCHTRNLFTKKLWGNGLLALLLLFANSCRPEFVLVKLENGNIYFTRGSVRAVIFNIPENINEDNFDIVRRKLEKCEELLHNFIFGTIDDKYWKAFEDSQIGVAKKHEIENLRYARKYIRDHYHVYKRQYLGLNLRNKPDDDIIPITFILNDFGEPWLDKPFTLLVESEQPMQWDVLLDIKNMKVIDFFVY